MFHWMIPNSKKMCAGILTAFAFRTASLPATGGKTNKYIILQCCSPADPCTSCAGTSPANSSTAPTAGGSVLFGAAASLDFTWFCSSWTSPTSPQQLSRALPLKGSHLGQVNCFLNLNRSGGSKVSKVSVTRCRVRCHLVAQRDHSFRTCKSWPSGKLHEIQREIRRSLTPKWQLFKENHDQPRNFGFFPNFFKQTQVIKVCQQVPVDHACCASVDAESNGFQVHILGVPAVQKITRLPD